MPPGVYSALLVSGPDGTLHPFHITQGPGPGLISPTIDRASTIIPFLGARPATNGIAFGTTNGEVCGTSYLRVRPSLGVTEPLNLLREFCRDWLDAVSHHPQRGPNPRH